MSPQELARFSAKTELRDSCWIWTCARSVKGYGRFRLGRVMQSAHRVSYEHYVGPVPDGLDLDHLCRNRLCVNPTHLEAVTRSENLRRSPLVGRHANRGHRIGGNNGLALRDSCVNGHGFTPENTRSRLDGGRACRACARIAQRATKVRRVTALFEPKRGGAE